MKSFPERRQCNDSLALKLRRTDPAAIRDRSDVRDPAGDGEVTKKLAAGMTTEKSVELENGVLDLRLGDLSYQPATP